MRVRKHLTYANVMATIAVFGVVAGGGAYAAARIDTSDLAPRAVTKKKLAGGAVTSSKIANEAVGTDQLSPSAEGTALVGLTYSPDTGAITYFNRTGGGKPRVDRVAPGTYALYFPGLEEFDFGTAAQSATLINTPLWAGEVTVDYDGCSGYCTPVHPVVTTRDSDGAKADNRPFSYLLFDTSAAGG